MKRTVSDPSNIVLRVDRDIGTQSMNRSHGDLLVPSIDHRKPYYPPSVSDECSTSSTSSVPSSPALNAEPSPIGTPLKYQHGLSYYITDHHEDMFFPGILL